MVSERGILEEDLEKSRAQISNLVAEVAALKNSLEENQVEMNKKENISELNINLRKFKDEVNKDRANPGRKSISNLPQN